MLSLERVLHVELVSEEFIVLLIAGLDVLTDFLLVRFLKGFHGLIVLFEVIHLFFEFRTP